MILVRQPWGLANRLFFFAHAMNLAGRHSTRVLGLHLPEADGVFEGAVHGALCCWPPLRHLPLRWSARTVHRLNEASLTLDAWLRRHPVPGAVVWEATLDDPIHQPLDSAALRRLRQPLVFLSGWINLHRLVLDDPGTIRRFFTLRQPLRAAIEGPIRHFRKDLDVLIGVHIRRGDFRTYYAGKYYYDDAVYRDLMDHMTRLHPGRRVGFLLCSDEPLNLAAFHGHRVHPGPGTVIGDLYSLAETDLILSPSSTYSLWAAFQGRKPYGVIRHAEHRPTLEDFVVPENHFRGLHPTVPRYEV